jgi:hypothetical protein
MAAKKKIPTLTLDLVLRETAERGWALDRTMNADVNAYVWRRGKQRLEVSVDRLRSSTFSMRKFNQELDLFDKARA